jgi:hypothetical protein
MSATASTTTAITNSLGVATFTVGDSVAETSTLSALDLTTGVSVFEPALAPVTITFTADEANQSTVTATPNVGATSWTVTVTLKDVTTSASFPTAANRTVALSAYVVGSPPTTPYTLSTTAYTSILTKGGKTTLSGTTGVIQFTVSDLVTQTLSIAVKDTSLGIQLLQLDQPLVITVYR